MASSKKIIKKNEEIISGDKELFVTLFETDRHRLYAYIFAFVANGSIADDIFQETSLLLWRDFINFTPGTDFSKWANGIAFNRIRSYRRKNKKYDHVFSESMLESLSETSAKDPDDELKWHTLQDCRAALPGHLKEIYEDFYVKNRKAQDVADKSGRSIFAIRKAIHKLRKKLINCVEHKKNKGMQ
ncbi:MAG: sigma-70 family RNA polymerase sigma factor [Lentisphaeraceae bacterium]|nr:sigma-70 family RNA polymerase sigma factor [Lentisphaeraceae bacterium]